MPKKYITIQRIFASFLLANRPSPDLQINKFFFLLVRDFNHTFGEKCQVTSLSWWTVI